ncbi:MAG: beta-N-acetylhexosaminidase [Opitutaceae bacterium]|nr:beta-N-acetylhexosaminidase [Opitutaceae bacterium]
MHLSFCLRCAFLLATLPTAAAAVAIIPAPVEVRENGGPGFVAGIETRLVWCQPPADMDPVAVALGDLLRPLLGQRAVGWPGETTATNAIIVDFNAAHESVEFKKLTSPEAYELVVTPERIVIHARTAHGAFNGVQTLRQLLPAEIERSPRPGDPAWQVPAVTVRDQPELQWRGLMLDCGRYYFTPGAIKKLLDLMALQKLNVFHWHLTEDQGWRIEIKKYPRLTSVGAWRAESPMRGDRRRGDRTRYGGFYTHEEIRDIVNYAAARFITIVPEVEMPGHSSAAIAAYPEFGNNDVPGFAPEVQTRWGVKPYTYAPKEETFAFLEDVLREVMDLFPGRYIHIGGDEAPKTQWKNSAFAQDYMRRHGLKSEDELQSHFVGRIAKFLTANGRTLIGWDEIQEGGTPAGAAVMLWRTSENWTSLGPKPAPEWKHAMAPLKAGHEIVVAPKSHFYLDYYQVDPRESAEPEAIGGLTTLADAYAFDYLVPGLTAEEQGRIVGLHGAIWAEHIWDFPKVEYMAFPRSCALAEVAWSAKERRDFADFQRRLEVFQRRLDELGVNYRKAGTIPRQTIQ